MRALDSYEFGMSATAIQPSRQTPHATPRTSQRRAQAVCAAARSSSKTSFMPGRPSEHAFWNDDHVAGLEHHVRLALALLEQIAEAQVEFALAAGLLVEPDQLRPVAGGEFAEPAHGDHRVKHGHVGAERDGRGLFRRADDPDLLAERAGEIGHDHADEGFLDVL